MARTTEIWRSEDGQDVTEYAVLLLLILLLVVGTVRLVSGKVNHVFSGVASDLEQTDSD
jgi:Flp pilus assembly pilin Flp